MRLKGRVDLPTSTQTSVPRTEYEISLQLSVACQEDPSSLTQALILGLWKQKELIPYPIQNKQRGWERASCYNQNIPHSNSLLSNSSTKGIQIKCQSRVPLADQKATVCATVSVLAAGVLQCYGPYIKINSFGLEFHVPSVVLCCHSKAF